MTKRPLVVATFAFLVGGLLCQISLVFLVLVPIGIGYGYSIKDKRVLIIALSLLYLLGGIRFYSFSMYWNRSKEQLVALEGEKYSILGTVDKKGKKTYGYYYELKDVQIYQDGAIYSIPSILLIQDTDQYPLQATIVAKGSIKLFTTARNDGNFNSYVYYKAKGIIGQIYPTKIKIIESNPNIHSALQQWRNRVGQIYMETMPEMEAGIMKAMLLGNKENVGEKTAKLYQVAGISHVLAISGTHLSIIILGFFKLIRKQRYSYLKSMIASLVVLFLFTMMTGRSISTIRAGIMLSLYLFGQWRGRAYDVVSSLALTVFLVVATNPFAVGSISLQYSVMAVIGAIYGNRILQYHFNQIHPMWSIALISFEIYLLTLPITVYNMHQISVGSILANVAIVPVLGGLIILGIMGGGIGMFSYSLAKVPLYFGTILIKYMTQIATWTTLGGHGIWITGTPDWRKTCVFILTVIVSCHYGYKTGKIKMVIIQVLAIMVLVIGNSQSGFYCAILDVGQGDGTFIQGDSNHTCMIDGGSVSIKNVGSTRIEPFLKAHGVKRINYWFISHADLDHSSGFIELAKEDYPIEHLVLYSGILEDQAKTDLLKVCQDHRIEVLYLNQFERLELGRIIVECVNLPTDLSYANRNDRSLQLVIKGESLFGFWGGDISKDIEKELAQTYELSSINFLKVSHHGSQTSSYARFIEEIKPKEAVISVGENNFGHPSADVIKRLKEGGTKVWITKQQGQYTYASP